MNETTRGGLRIAGISTGIVAAFAAAIIGGQAIAANLPQADPEPTPTSIVGDPTPTPTVTATPTPTPTVEPVVEAPAPVVEEAPAPDPGPDLCPGGTTAQSSDGYNDLTCAPDVCLTLRGLPDPAYPECDHFYEPAYYR
jgi:hypothetical protein